MTYKNVINAINKGLSVYWFNTNYKIIKDNDRYLIHSQSIIIILVLKIVIII